MARRVPQELIQLIVLAGHHCLRAWCSAAGLNVRSLYTSRWRGDRPSDRVLDALLRSSRSPVDRKKLAAALIIRGEQ